MFQGKATEYGNISCYIVRGKLYWVGLGPDCCIIHFTDHTISVLGYIYHTSENQTRAGLALGVHY